MAFQHILWHVTLTIVDFSSLTVTSAVTFPPAKPLADMQLQILSMYFQFYLLQLCIIFVIVTGLWNWSFSDSLLSVVLLPQLS